MIEIPTAPSVHGRYQQATTASLAVRHPPAGILSVSGEDRLDFLHRMSTNELAHLAQGSGVVTVFTTALGRIVEVARVLAHPDQALLITPPGRAESLSVWLQRYLFFQDRVTLTELTGPFAHWGIYGPQALERARGILPQLPALEPGSHAGPVEALAWSVAQPLPGLELLLQGPAAERAQASWSSGPAEEAAFETLRVEAGLPAPGREISEEAIPLEVGLWEAVNFRKGCYIGQEIIARMESRGKLARQLVGVRLDQPSASGVPLRQGEMLQGSLTSVVESPRFGWIGLAVVRTAALAEAGGRVQVGENGAAGQIVELPFR